ncbi:MAG: hypothetical protein KatS3mg028_1697 [Bacteroidia bacterium]|nr:MAG: hypothetical protein KatS3mg028_1697 [Bacteroidia bacterium]
MFDFLSNIIQFILLLGATVAAWLKGLLDKWKGCFSVSSKLSIKRENVYVLNKPVQLLCKFPGERCDCLNLEKRVKQLEHRVFIKKIKPIKWLCLFLFEAVKYMLGLDDCDLSSLIEMLVIWVILGEKCDDKCN